MKQHYNDDQWPLTMACLRSLGSVTEQAAALGFRETDTIGKLRQRPPQNIVRLLEQQAGRLLLRAMIADAESRSIRLDNTD